MKQIQILVGIIAFAFFLAIVLSQTVYAEEVRCTYKINEIKKKMEIKCTGYTSRLPFGDIKKKLNIFGTEYFPEGVGTVFFQLLDSGMPVNDASCVLTVYNKTKGYWIRSAPMDFLEDGLYYYDIQAPEDAGTYMLSAFCLYMINKTDVFPHYLKVNSGKSAGNFPSGLYERNDGTVHKVKEVSDVLDFEYWINATLPANTTEIHLKFFGRWNDKEEEVEIYAYNYNTGSWDKLPNPIRWSKEYVDTNNMIKENFTDYFNDSILKVRFKDTSSTTGTDSTLTIDFFESSMVYLTGRFIEDIRGGGEIHVHDLNYTFQSIGLWKKLLGIQEEITSVNDTVKEGFGNLNLTSVNDTVKEGFENLNQNMLGNFTSVNDTVKEGFNKTWENQTTIYNKLLSNFENLNQNMLSNFTSVNDTVNEGFNKTWEKQDEWGNTIYNGLNNWGNELKNKIQEGFENLNQNMLNNFTYTNSLINAVNTTVTWWGDYIYSRLNWWGDLLNATINWWGNELENKIDSIILGNVTVTALVDYDEIALTVLQYLKSVKIW